MKSIKPMAFVIIAFSVALVGACAAADFYRRLKYAQVPRHETDVFFDIGLVFLLTFAGLAGGLAGLWWHRRKRSGDDKTSQSIAMSSKKSYFFGFGAAIFAAACLNLLPYVMTRGAYHGDGFEVVGFPFTFYRMGGFAGIQEFRIMALIGDIGLALIVGLAAGCVFASVSRNQSPK